MHKNKVTLTVILVLGIVVAMAPPITAPPSFDVVFVDDEALGSGHFNDIPSALGAVAPGGTMYIAAGHYILDSSLNLSFDLTIVGEGSDVVLIDADGGDFNIFFVNGADFELSGCSLTGGRIGVELIMRENTALISNNAIYGNSIGIFATLTSLIDSPALDGGLDELNNLLISNNAIYDNESQGIGLMTFESYNVIDIMSNEVYGNGRSGIEMGGDLSSAELSIGHNTLHDNGSSSSNTGIYIHELANLLLYLEIFDNQIYDENGDGIYISGNTDASSDYMWFWVQESISIHDNNIVGCSGNGISMDLSMHVYDYTQFIIVGDAEDYDYETEYVGICNNTVANNQAEGIDIYFTTTFQHLEDLEIGQVDDYTFHVSAIVTIAENEIYGNSGRGIRAYLEQADDLQMPLGALDGNGAYYFETYLWAYRNEIYDNGISGIYLESMPSLIENNLIVGNFSMQELDGQTVGSGILLFDCFETYLINNTIVANVYGIFNESSYIYIFNNIIASNIISGICDIEDPTMGGDGRGTQLMGYNDVWGNGTNYLGLPDNTGINGNISEDPQFYGMYDARLLSVSPCIDSGLYEMVSVVFEDLVGTPRPQGQGIDMGCYEMYDQVWSPHYIQPLAVLSTSRANSMWGCIMPNLPTELDTELEALIEEVQGLMQQAGSLSNPVYTNGLMQQAIELMQELSDLLGCGC